MNIHVTNIIGLICGFVVLIFCIRGCANTPNTEVNAAYGYGWGIVISASIIGGLLSRHKKSDDEDGDDEEFEKVKR